jgi:hypothetical protein
VGDGGYDGASSDPRRLDEEVLRAQEVVDLLHGALLVALRLRGFLVGPAIVGSARVPPARRALAGDGGGVRGGGRLRTTRRSRG